MQAELSVKCYYSHRWVLKQAEDEYIDQFPRYDLRSIAVALVLVYVSTLLAYVLLVSRVMGVMGIC